ncbi:MAG TPA: hypothetical protein VIG80_13850 [Bacillaceae bacterium]
MKFVLLGAVSIPIAWVAMAAAFLITGAYLAIIRKKATADWYGNAVLAFVFVWKLSVILFDFRMVLDHPISILYFHGGSKGFWLGIAAAILYIVMSKKKFSDATFAWLLTISIYELLFGLLNQDALWILIPQLAANSLFVYLVQSKHHYRWQVQALILFTFVQALVYSLRGELFSEPVIVCGWFALFFAIWLKKRSADS